jgi:hypothetical protein
MKRNQKVQVSEETKFSHNRGRVGYFQFFGEGPSNGVAVLTVEPTDSTKGSPGRYFAVKKDEIKIA